MPKLYVVIGQAEHGFYGKETDTLEEAVSCIREGQEDIIYIRLDEHDKTVVELMNTLQSSPNTVDQQDIIIIPEGTVALCPLCNHPDSLHVQAIPCSIPYADQYRYCREDHCSCRLSMQPEGKAVYDRIIERVRNNAQDRVKREMDITPETPICSKCDKPYTATTYCSAEDCPMAEVHSNTVSEPVSSIGFYGKPAPPYGSTLAQEDISAESTVLTHEHNWQSSTTLNEQECTICHIHTTSSYSTHRHTWSHYLTYSVCNICHFRLDATHWDNNGKNHDWMHYATETRCLICDMSRYAVYQMSTEYPNTSNTIPPHEHTWLNYATGDIRTPYEIICAICDIQKADVEDAKAAIGNTGRTKALLRALEDRVSRANQEAPPSPHSKETWGEWGNKQDSALVQEGKALIPIELMIVSSKVDYFKCPLCNKDHSCPETFATGICVSQERIIIYSFGHTGEMYGKVIQDLLLGMQITVNDRR